MTHTYHRMADALFVSAMLAYLAVTATLLACGMPVNIAVGLIVLAAITVMEYLHMTRGR